MRAWWLVVMLAGCSAPVAEPPEAAPQQEPLAAPILDPQIVFDGRLSATGANEATALEFEVPENYTRLLLRTDALDDVAAGRYQLHLENPAGKTWLVYGGYGYRAPTNSVQAGSGDGSVDAPAVAGTWILRANTDGHVDLAARATVVP